MCTNFSSIEEVGTPCSRGVEKILSRNPYEPPTRKTKRSTKPLFHVASRQAVRKRLKGILRFIDCRLTNARLEGMNNKIRLLSHRAYGFHSADSLIATIYLCCSKLMARVAV
ncbi:MAG: transposase [Actinomycetia bacterium]|nr:transposase [Actinomycetes bacterium]